MLRLRSTLALLVASFALAPLPSASAGGYQLPIQGVRSLGVAGALVAGAEGGDAFWYNPSRLGDTSVGLSVSMVSLDARFTRSDGDQAGQTVENLASPTPNPSLSAILRLTEAVSVGIGAYAPYGAQYSFPEDGPQRYALVENDKTKLLFVHLAGSVEMGDFRLGAGVQNVVAHVIQRSTFSGYTGLFGWPEDRELDVLTELELQDPSTITANVGASYELGPVTFGASIQLPYTVSGEANLRVRLPSSVYFDSSEVEGDRTFVEIPFPLSLRGGAQWQIDPRWTVEVAAGFEGWSIQQEVITDPRGNMTLHGLPGVGDYVLGPVSVDRRMKDTFSLHLGADGNLIETLHVRGGLFYESSSFGDETFSVALLDDDKIGLSLGASYAFGPVRLDLAAARIFQGTRVVENSQLRQVNPTNPSQTNIVGNGSYESGYWVAGLAAAIALDPPEDPELGSADGDAFEQLAAAAQARAHR